MISCYALASPYSIVHKLQNRRYEVLSRIEMILFAVDVKTHKNQHCSLGSCNDSEIVSHKNKDYTEQMPEIVLESLSRNNSVGGV